MKPNNNSSNTNQKQVKNVDQQQQGGLRSKSGARRSFELTEEQEGGQDLFSLTKLGGKSPNQPKLQPITQSKDVSQTHHQLRNREEKVANKSPRNKGVVHDVGGNKNFQPVKLVSLPQKHRRSSAYSVDEAINSRRASTGQTARLSAQAAIPMFADNVTSQPPDSAPNEKAYKKHKSKDFEKDVEQLGLPFLQHSKESESIQEGVDQKLTLSEFLSQKGRQQSILNNLDPNNNNLQIADLNDHVNTEALRYNHQVRNQQLDPNAYIHLHNIQNSLTSVKTFKVREMSAYMLEVALHAADAIQEGINLHHNGWNVNDIIDIAQHSIKQHPKGVLNDQVRKELRQSDHGITREQLRQLQTLEVKNTNPDPVQFAALPTVIDQDSQSSTTENLSSEGTEAIKEHSADSEHSNSIEVGEYEIGEEGVCVFQHKINKKLRQHLADLLSLRSSFQTAPISFNLKDLTLLNDFQKDEDGEIRRSIWNSVPAKYKKDAEVIIMSGNACLEVSGNQWKLKKHKNI